MLLTTRVKINSITNLSDARYGAGMGVEFIGFNINPESDDYVDPVLFNQITGWISGVKLVGELTNPSQLNKEYGFSYLEISDSDLISELGKAYPLIYSMQEDQYHSGEIMNLCDKVVSDVEFILIPLKIIRKLSEDEAITLCGDYPVFINEADADFVKEQLIQYKPQGIALKSGKEEITGFKAYDELADVLELIVED